ncbi:MAG: sorbosone dehydrogenase family protein [Pseudorhodoplanes sp.]|uniref:PQQ-dependent sugar dehydrogenase n=1 Tax=Pseudorhodoplanes sp. TaxID=1934341 RepID=UPI003D0AC353
MKPTSALFATLFIAMAGLAWPAAALAQAEIPEQAVGPQPKLPEPEEGWLPTINWARAEPWPQGTMPKAAEGLAVKAFARNLKHPRWVYVLPNGDVLVAEAASEPSPSWNPRALVQNWVMRRAGSIVENANRISLLRDTDGDGVADQHHVFLEGLRQPFGMALIGDQFYVANTDSVVRYPYKEGETSIKAEGTKLVDIPVGHHWTRNIMPSADGSKLFITVGSGSNIGEKGMAIEKDRATIWELDLASGKSRVFASGLRNANGMAIEPTTGTLWTSVNERDGIGDNVPPDYLTSVKDGGFYGWPYSYWGKIVDERVQPQRPDLVAQSITPDYALGGHTSAIGLTWYGDQALPAPFRNGMFVGLHGSWNRSDLSGYRVVFVPFRDGRPAGDPIDVLTGFVKDGESVANGRPVGVTVTREGSLLVADDAGNAIWHVTAASGGSPTSNLGTTPTTGAATDAR